MITQKHLLSLKDCVRLFQLLHFLYKGNHCQCMTKVNLLSISHFSHDILTASPSTYTNEYIRKSTKEIMIGVGVLHSTSTSMHPSLWNKIKCFMVFFSLNFMCQKCVELVFWQAIQNYSHSVSWFDNIFIKSSASFGYTVINELKWKTVTYSGAFVYI